MRFWLTTITVLLLDRASKLWIMSHMNPGSSWDLINGILSITYIFNPGAAFGIMQGKAGLFVVAAAVVITFALYFMYKYNPALRIQYALALIVGGALGNVIDRIFYNAVVDFISVGWFPIFNVADIAIVCGGALLLIYILLNGDEPSR